MLFVIFLVAALLCSGLLISTQKLQFGSGLRPEGIAFVVAVLIAGAAGFVIHELNAGPFGSDALIIRSNSDLSQLARPLLSPQLKAGLQLFLLGLGVYLLSAARGLARLPAWIADVLVIGAAFLATRVSSDVILQVAQTAGHEGGNLELGPLDTIITVGWIWLVSRLCASLNRVPAVAGGYLGLFALTVLCLWEMPTGASNFFGLASLAALSGAGLAAFFIVFRSSTINLGWSSILSMGFLLGTASSMGLLKNTLPALVALSVLALGLPLINVSIVKVRARLRGYSVDWTSRRLRLDQALARRGVPPRKIALYYFSIGVWLCLLTLLSGRWFFDRPPGLLLGLIYALILAFLAASGAIVFFSLARLQMRRQPYEDIPDLIEAFGVKISPVSMEEAIDKIEGFIQSKTPHHVVTSDANAILTAKNDPLYLSIIRNAALITPDGFGVIWGARLLNLPIYERVTGVDMVTGICERAAKKGYSIYILGSEEGVAPRAAQNLAEKYSGLKVAGTHHGFWRRDGKENGLTTEQADEKMADEICSAKPDVLFVAMGIPMQEKFISAQLQRLNVPVALGVGGSFDVYSGKFNRAPQWVQRAGMEWLYRVWIDPSRWRRMSYVPRFMLVALKTWLLGPREDKQEAF